MKKWLLDKIKLILIIIFTITGMAIPSAKNTDVHYSIFFIAFIAWLIISVIDQKD